MNKVVRDCGREEALLMLVIQLLAAAGWPSSHVPVSFRIRRPAAPILPIMNVTRSNFLQVLKGIEDAVADCDFVSIDEELSGLRKGRGGHMFDLQEERYRKMRDACMSYSIIQFGLTCFRKNAGLENGLQSYDSHSFNIFIFPYKVQGLPRHLERNVEMQTSAVSFLRAHQFDFNTLFDEGISYLTLKEEEECEKALRDNEEKTCQQGTVVPEDMRDFVDGCVDQVRAFASQDGDTDQRLDLPACTAFKRKLLYEALSSDSLRDSISIATLPVAPASRDCFLSITRSSPAAKRKKAKDILTEAAGFSKILQIISKCKKPLVGHNLFLDIMHVVGQFLTELPDTYEEFKESVHDMFPALYDTKYIASTLALRKLIPSSTLEDLTQTLGQGPFQPVCIRLVNADDAKPEVARSGDGVNTSFHQAGYDSYITGHCFIRMNNYLQQVLGGKPAADEVIGCEIRRYVSSPFAA